MAHSLDEIVARFGGTLNGDGAVRIDRLATLDHAGPSDLSFLANPKYRSQLSTTRAAAVIVSAEAAADCPVTVIVTPNPYLFFARVSQWLANVPNLPEGRHPSAEVESPVPSSVHIGSHVSISQDVLIGEGVVVESGCRIGPGVTIGAGSHLYPGVTIYHDCHLGQRVIVHSGAVIGSDGFGFAQDGVAWVKIAQTGRVLIGDDVEIGANTTIDRGALEDTVIEEGVKLDNQIQVGHNVRIGAHTAMAGCVGIAGSAKIGARCTVGGGAIILGHLKLADGVHISAGTLVSKSINVPGSYTGMVPFMPHDDWQRNFARLRHLDEMADKLRALEKRIAQLENSPEKKT